MTPEGERSPYHSINFVTCHDGFTLNDLVSYDGKGRQRWLLELGPFRNFYGIAASPILAGDLVVMVCDQAVGSFLVAVEKDTGARGLRAILEEAMTDVMFEIPSKEHVEECIITPGVIRKSEEPLLVYDQDVDDDEAEPSASATA